MNLADYLLDAPWKEKAACRDAETDIFFPSQEAKSFKAAKAICARCQVTVECLDEALSNSQHYDFGVWGATTPSERRKLRKQRRAAA